ncbi:ABC transporter permease [Oceanirhabdus sp. W0125-5]|uniref:ABC transporter permease n=1 Tax=Oceanirhabdus sp. W0125-5 TaxID=2999116 RepID=UPI0022F2D19C|nr:ABC transporter permease [Oceanirhabdus sp. W0125-5]WBW97798.1 ABC transporter permease [Oceanirhabdus sp. W0125-5]
MGTIVLCELKKVKPKWWQLLLISFVLYQVGGMFLGISLDSADKLFTWVQLGLFSYTYLAATNILAAVVILNEFTNKAATTTFTYKQERWKIYIGKIITIFIISLMIYAIIFCFMLIISFISFRSTLTLEVIVKHLVLTLKAYGYQMLMVTGTASIALVCKNYVAPIIYIGIQLFFSFLYLNSFAMRPYVPFSLPVVNNLMLIKDQYRILKGLAVQPSQVAIAVILFIGGLALGLIYTNKMEVEK